jgi:hypothetical protein
VRKQKRLSVPLIAIGVFLVVSVLLPFPDAVRATEVIADNFNDMDYAGWDTYGMMANLTGTPELTLAGSANFSAADQTLKVTGPEGNMTYSNWNNAYRASAVSFGKWSFDVYVVNSTRPYAYINLIRDHYYPRASWSNIPGPTMNNCYDIFIWTRYLHSGHDRPEITLGRVTNGAGMLLGSYEVGSPSDTWTNCWTHFDVIRNTTGHIMVYINGTLRISTLDYSRPITGYFMFTGQSGWAIDSVVISGTSDVPDIPTVDPPPNFTLPLIAISAIELIVIVVLVILYFRRRS